MDLKGRSRIADHRATDSGDPGRGLHRPLPAHRQVDLPLGRGDLSMEGKCAPVIAEPASG